MFADSVVRKKLLLILSLVLAGTCGACAAFRAADPNGPTSNAPLYPIEFADAARLEQAALSWYQLSQRYGLPEKTEANLHPYTGTIQSLPANLKAPIFLPKVGSQTDPTEEETRESLRGFIVEWQSLIGAKPEELSLVERTDEPSGLKIARYEQRPFRYPLRGAFGRLFIRFRSDGQIVELSSSCLPNADRVQPSLSGLTPTLTAEQAVAYIKTQAVPVTDEYARQQQINSLPASATVEARELVVYAQPSQDPPGGLQIRLAWEIDITNSPISKVYLDAISGQVIAAT